MSYVAELGHHNKSLTVFRGPYINLSFQDGPIQEQGVNGTTNEEIIQLLVTRLTSFQTAQEGKFACTENALAITHLETALAWLTLRTKRREERGVEGTYTP